MVCSNAPKTTPKTWPEVPGSLAGAAEAAGHVEAEQCAVEECLCSCEKNRKKNRSAVLFLEQLGGMTPDQELVKF